MNAEYRGQGAAGQILMRVCNLCCVLEDRRERPVVVSKWPSL